MLKFRNSIWTAVEISDLTPWHIAGRDRRHTEARIADTRRTLLQHPVPPVPLPLIMTSTPPRTRTRHRTRMLMLPRTRITMSTLPRTRITPPLQLPEQDPMGRGPLRGLPDRPPLPRTLRKIPIMGAITRLTRISRNGVFKIMQTIENQIFQLSRNLYVPVLQLV